MSIENQKILEVYDKLAKRYLENTAVNYEQNAEKVQRKKAELKSFLEEGFSSLAKGGKVLEIGSSDGMDAEILESLGFEVTPSDVAEDFLEAIREKGFEPLKLDILKDEIREKYDGVFCWRTFVHFTKEDLAVALDKIYKALNPGGVAIFNVMNMLSSEDGKKDAEWLDLQKYPMGVKRFYQYYRKDELLEIVETVGFRVKRFEEKKEWFNLVVKRS